MSYPRNEVMRHLLELNLSLVFERQASIGEYTNIFIANCLVESHILGTMFSKGITAPLYLYPEQTNDLFAKIERIPNLNQTIIDKMAEGLEIPFVAGKTHNSNLITHNSFAPIDVLDYIYAVLHSPAYREKYKEFLKIDFPKVPYPKDLLTFWKLVKLGGEIREIHLLESPVVEEYITEYPEDGNNVVVKLKYENGRVYINENQYFDKVPETAWNFYIGGYQPAQKWLKDRKERELSFEDILHYQKIIVALSETARIMVEIDLVGVE
jgi:predicted helicase